MKYTIYGILAMMAVILPACSDDEEILEPSSGYVDNKFEVPADATGPEAELRREFYAKYGSYLLFNDLLSHEYQGKDAEGNDVYKDEYVDFTYNLNSVSLTAPTLDLFNDIDDMSGSVALYEKYIYPHIKDSKLIPFSILLADNIRVPKNSWTSTMIDTPTTSCMRCLGLATGAWLDMSESEQEEYAKTLLYSVVTQNYNASSEAASDFLEISSEYYGEYLSDINDDWDREDDYVYSLGFLSYNKSSWGTYYDYLLYKDVDFEAFARIVLFGDEDEFMEQYGDYARIVTKYNIMKESIQALGYKF